MQNVTEQLNRPHVRNDINTLHAVVSHIRARYANDGPYGFGEVHKRACVQAALKANDATVGCELADQIAAKLSVIRERFASEVNLRGSL